MFNARVSVITPTYNDEKSVEETLKSLVSQTYSNWEWILVNDGSTDRTEQVLLTLIQKYGIADKCKYVYQNNSDQLNAIIHGTDYVTGEYIFVLHSDDLLPDTFFFENCVNIMQNNSQLDGLFGDLIIIDETSSESGVQKVKRYRNSENELALMLLWLGRNIYSDVAFHRTEVYLKYVKRNYLLWNTPLWSDFFEKEICMLNYQSVDFPVLRYRVHQGNYINSEVGMLNVINGELRTAVELMNCFYIPCYKLQYYLFRILNKFFPDYSYKVKYSKRETKNKYSVVSFIIKQRYRKDIGENLFLLSVLEFYKKKTDRVLEIPKIDSGITLYYGKDVRLFNNRLLSNTLEPFYYFFMREMIKGFDSVVVQDVEDHDKMQIINRFFCVGHVKIIVKD